MQVDGVPRFKSVRSVPHLVKTFLMQLGNSYGALVGAETEAIVVRFFGIFFAFFQSSAIWGALISSTGKSSCSTC